VPPAWLLWLLPVPAATLLAVAWTAWSGRARGPEEPEVSVRAHERFRRALAAPLPVPPPATDGERPAGERTRR
jgi:cytochrome c-type biogenesis protein CcmH/NrfF